jgi:hypothetical protein
MAASAAVISFWAVSILVLSALIKNKLATILPSAVVSLPSAAVIEASLAVSLPWAAMMSF